MVLPPLRNDLVPADNQVPDDILDTDDWETESEPDIEDAETDSEPEDDTWAIEVLRGSFGPYYYTPESPPPTLPKVSRGEKQLHELLEGATHFMKLK